MIKRKKPNAARGAGGASAGPALRRELDTHREELAAQNEELRRANAALVSSRHRYAELYESCPIAYFTLDASGMIVEANAAVGELLGGSRRFVFGRKFEDLVAPSSRASFRRFRERVLELGGRQAHATVLATSARRFPVRIQGAPFTGLNECLLTVTEETERREQQVEVGPPANDSEPRGRTRRPR